MAHRRWIVLGALVAVLAAILACGGLSGGPAMDPVVATGLDQIEPTRVAEAGAVEQLPLMDLEGAGPPPMSSGEGLQVLQVSPLGVGRKALQVAVVFDRPMVALTQLDTMIQSVPLSCDGEVELAPRWAGTSTAVLLPRTEDKALPNATAFTCTVPAGTAAVDGTELENTITWTFETPRPRVVSTVPRKAATGVSLEEPLVVRFDQPVDAGVVAAYVSLRSEGGGAVAIEGVDPVPDDPRAVRIRHGTFRADTAYVLTVAAGVRGTAGPLGSTEPHELRFRTYPPLVVEEHEPVGRGVDPIVTLSLAFSTEVTQEEVAERVRLEPAPVDEWSPPEGSWSSRRWAYRVRLLPRTEYTVTLEPGLPDVHGQLLEGRSWTFTTGDYQPWIDVATGMNLYAANNPPELPVRHLNASTVQVRIGSVAPEDLPGGGGAWPDVDRLLGPDAATLSLPTEDAPNEVEIDFVDLAPHLTEGHGLVAWKIWSPQVPPPGEGRQPYEYEGLALVTDLAGTLKVSPGAVDTWITRLSDGRPVQNAEVALYVGSEEVGTARTDASGLARFAGYPGPTWERWNDDQRVYAIARVGADWTVVNHEWNDGIGPWLFGVWGSWDPDGRDAVSHGFADRGVYRPGDPAHARATFRLQTARGLELPGQAAVAWSFSDPEGAEIVSGTGELDDRGGFSVDLQVPEDGPLGDHTLRIEASGEGWSATEWISIPARAYRAPAFRVSVDGPVEAVAGSEITTTVDARYLFGAPLSEAEVTWRTWTEARWFRPEGWEGWSFGPESRWWDEDEQHHSQVVDSEVAPLAEGRHALVQELPGGRFERPVTWFVEAEVTDTDRQAIAGRSEVLVHPAAWYVGLKPKERLPEAGSPTGVQVVGVDPGGEPHTSGEVAVKVLRRTWDRVREKGMDGRWRWVSEPTDTEVASSTVSLSAQPSLVEFTPEEPGLYLVQAESTDASGNPVRASDSLYVTGSGYASWALSDDQKLELVPDKALYRPGDTARVLVKSPRPGLSALVTLEREGVLWREVVQLEGTAATVEIPIGAEHRPNVFVSVLAVTGAGPQDAPDKGRPEVRLGLVELEVDAEPEHLEVAVQTDAEVYRPRDAVDVTVRVAREGRALAGAGVTLYAVDESVLSLTAYQTPDAHGAFYRKRGLSVITADGRVRVLDRAPYLTKGAPRGGGGGDGEATGPEVRSRFLTTIAWEPDLRTGPDGTVTTRLELPDNLTTFRIMAVADEGAVGFGSADREIRVTRPVIARPALPRFLRAGDTAFAGVVVHNNTDAARSIEVTGRVEGPAELQGSPVTVTVPAHGAREVPFRLRGLEPGEATFEFTLESGAERDAVRWPIPVRRDLIYETVATAGTTTDRAVERIARPDDALRPFGGLEVDVASTVLVGADAGLQYLVDYPHGCVEQITSRAMGSLYALEMREAAGVALDEATLRGNVEGVLRDLAAYEHHTGGVAYWRGSDHASVVGTAYVVELMGRAREGGFAVDEARLRRHVSFLREVLNGRHVPRSWDPLLSLSTRAYVAVAMARAGAGDAGHNNTLYGQRRNLSVLGAASLLEAIARTTGPDGRTAELEQAILARTTIEATTASVKENSGGRWARLWGSDDLSTAAALEALLVARGEHPMAVRFAQHLSSSRRNGHWHNTRATAGVLAALARYARTYESAEGQVQAEVALAGQELAAEALAVPEALSVDLPMDRVDNGELVFGAEGGRLYYQARLSYVPRQLPARDEGFTVRRSFEILDGGGEDGAVTSGALMRVTLQVVTPVQRHAVAVVDPLPAGLEAVESSFATSSRAPRPTSEEEGGEELPAYGGSWVFDHHELRDDQVRLYADYMPPGIHTWRYVVRATTPGTFDHPAATAEEMYEPENFGRTAAGSFTVGRGELEPH